VDVKQWDDIKEAYGSSCLVLGNGGSMAVHPGFSYQSLKVAAVERGYLNETAGIFERFDTADFELVLRLLWQADIVNHALQAQAPAVRGAYETVRTALIRTVRDVHVEHGDLGDSLFTPAAERVLLSKNAFLASFQLVVSLNYDLLVYWARMADNVERSRDCFGYEDGQLVFEGLPEQLEPQVSYFVYPHGSLWLVRDRYGQETKLRGGAATLLGSAVQAWESGEHIPLFVSEGSSEQKLRAIRSSAYLSAAYAGTRKRTQKNALVLFGWRLGDQDKHIVDALKSRRPTRVAVSVYDRAEAAIEDLVRDISRTFGVEPDLFAADSVGAWSRRSATLAQRGG
jgi:hypothetical protein